MYIYIDVHMYIYMCIYIYIHIYIYMYLSCSLFELLGLGSCCLLPGFGGLPSATSHSTYLRHECAHVFTHILCVCVCVYIYVHVSLPTYIASFLDGVDLTVLSHDITFLSPLTLQSELTLSRTIVGSSV